MIFTPGSAKYLRSRPRPRRGRATRNQFDAALVGPICRPTGDRDQIVKIRAGADDVDTRGADPAAQARAENEIRARFADKYAQRDAPSRRALAHLLLITAQESPADPATLAVWERASK